MSSRVRLAGLLVTLATACVPCAFAAGNTEAQEVGDMVFRGLGAPIANILNDHGALYEGKRPTPDPEKHGLVEMFGTSDPRCPLSDRGCVVLNTLPVFKSAFPPYYGAYDFNAPNGADRRAFVAIGRSLLGLPYVDSFRTRFVQWEDDDGDGAIDPTERVTNLRSDAFTEYCYTKRDKLQYSPGADFWASRGEAFGANMIDRADLYNTLHELADIGLVTIYTPRKQREHMTPSVPLLDEFELKELMPDGTEGRVIPNDGTGVTGRDTFHARIKDLKSGPGCLEVWRGDPGNILCGEEASTVGGATRVFLDNTSFDAVEHIYTIPPLGGEGLHVVIAADRASNATRVNIIRKRLGSLDEPA